MRDISTRLIGPNFAKSICGHGGRCDGTPDAGAVPTLAGLTPLAITLNIDSFEHLEFETRPDQLLVYTLVQGDERVIVEFAPIGPTDDDHSPFAPRQLAFDTSDFVQMELLGMEVREED